MSCFKGKRLDLFIVSLAIFVLCLYTPVDAANLYLNVVAVNGTEESKEKEIKAVLPRELTADDILDTDGLKLEYDVDASAYIVTGKVTLTAKETKTYKILIRDLWQFEDEKVNKITEQIETSFKQLEGTEYYKTGKIKMQTLEQRLDFLLQEQARHKDNIEKRIDTYRVYAQEFEDIREKAVSIKYWRAKPPEYEDADIFYFVVGIENIGDETATNDKRNYLPKEIKPEQFIDLQEFDIRYDASKERSYLIKEIELKPKERKQYSVGVVDIWNINQTGIDNLWERARTAYKFIEPTQYVDNANFLMESIKLNLGAIEETQAREKSITEHISVYRKNVKRFDIAKKDVEALDELLEIIREELKRSKLENILKKIRGLRTLVDIAKSIMQKPADAVAWRIIVGVLAFVGVLSLISFVLWGSRSRNMLDETAEEKKEESEKE